MKDSFRSYDSLEQSADDYGRFLSVNKRYATAFSYPNDPEKFIHEIAKAEYATNPAYEKNIVNIIRTTGIKDYDTVWGGEYPCVILIHCITLVCWSENEKVYIYNIA
ncbi:glucosaminidase domain-containing protein [Citrobacter koseri]|uniref:glucosaminidase domain-containing protein n=1 Tax=Citrobacter koseri TaxID=545 RepID=UPI0030CA3859